MPNYLKWAGELNINRGEIYNNALLACPRSTERILETLVHRRFPLIIEQIVYLM